MIARRVPVRIASIALGFILAVPLAGVSANILDTKHNLVAGSSREASEVPGARNRRVSTHVQADEPSARSTDASQVCAFCHTPYGEEGAIPSWQRSGVEERRAFSTFASFGGSLRENVAELGSVSIACMSCHDGTQAVNVAGNPFPAPSPHGLGIGGVPEARVSLRPPAQIGLSASHPVGIPYVGEAPGSSRSLSTTALTVGSAEQREIRAGFRTAESALINGVTVWWIETGNPGRQRNDIHLYSRDRDDGTSEPYVECSSCHDPHTQSRMFLRHAGRDNFICVTCHVM